MSELEILTREHEQLKQEYAYLKQELAELKRLLFGRKSERFVPVNPTQLQLFDEPVAEVAAEPEVQIIERKKPVKINKPVRKELPAHLPRKTTILEPENIDLTKAVRIGEEVTEFLNYTPAKIYVEQIIRPKYKIEDGQIVIAELKDAQPIAKSNVGVELLVFLLVSKYVDHLPLYRLVKMFKREKVDIAESTMNNWVQNGLELLRPLFEYLQKQLKKSSYLQADETPLAVLESLKPGCSHKGYYWVYHSPVDHLIYFQYHKSRSGEAVRNHLQGYKGYLQTDGYSGYLQFEKDPGVHLMACMAHVRRKFHNAQDNNPALAQQALLLIGQLYDVEREAREGALNAQQRKALRQIKAIPILDHLEDWLKQQLSNLLPKSSFGEAVLYTLNHWKRLKVYLQDGHLEIDNNLIENKIRPIALGRKNYLFAGSHQSAEKAGMLYSLMAMCDLEEINPITYLCDTIKKIQNHPINRIEELLPAQWKKLQSI